MKMPTAINKAVLSLAAATSLAGCVADTGGTTGSSGGLPFITTFDPAVSNAAVTACTNALRAQTNDQVQLAGSEFSQANTAIYMRLASNGAPWRCIVSNDGTGPELMFMGSEGSA